MRPAAFPDALIVLAGGAGRRLGGVDKAEVRIGGRSLLERALAAGAGRPTVVVGPPRDLPPGVLSAQEDPPGGGPAAGVVAGFAALRELLSRADGDEGVPALVGILAVDQPGVGADTLRRLAEAVRAGHSAAPHRPGGAVLVHRGRRQYAAGVFPVGALDWAVRQRRSWHGVALRSLVGGIVAAEVPAIGDEALDVDTDEDLARWRSGCDAADDGTGAAGLPPAR
ncbi:MAG TPA: NTP transferase domain-containing protein [Nakamurella sp.]|nr:NTP transferase domain-containing protein [Nakamurella sp.]